ncbi:MAG: hypothetical protein GY847_08490 [Proteobacteria bacterium]|nr:hypothetical protein [Pseudomonadota bacterium]
MRVNQLFVVVMLATFIVACAEEVVQPPPPIAPIAQPSVAQVPEAPKIVYAAADPQHGGVRHKIGDYMVELATGAEGKIDAYVQKYEGDTPSFEDVQVEMLVEPKAEVEKAGTVDDEVADDKVADDKSVEEEGASNVVFYPKDGKLQGTVAGLPKGAYDIAVKIFDIKDDRIAEHKFENVELDPLDTELKAEHGGEVQIVDKTKMEVVREGTTVKVWLSDLENKKLAPTEAALKQLVVNLDDGSKEELEIDAKDDHFEADVKGKFNPELFKIVMARLFVAGNEYPKLRLPRILARAAAKKGLTKKDAVKKDPKLNVPAMTTNEAKKKDKPVKMKGTVGTMSVGKVPPSERPVRPILRHRKKKVEESKTVSKTKKGSVSTVKKAD